MKILWLCRDYETKFKQREKSNANLIFKIKELGGIDVTWDDVTVDYINNYDIVVVSDMPRYRKLKWKNVNATKCLYITDIQYNKPSKNLKQMNAYKSIKVALKYFDHIFTNSPQAWKKLWSKENFKNVHIIPLSANGDKFKDYNQEKDIDILLTGNVTGKIYPIRRKMLELFRDHKGFQHVRPKQKPLKIGVNYSKLLNKAKISCSCTSMYNFTVAKSFEIPASMSALLSDLTADMRDLGFKDEENMIRFDNNVKEKVEHYLKNPDKLKVLTTNGYNLVHENHTTEIRARKFLQYLEKMK